MCGLYAGTGGGWTDVAREGGDKRACEPVILLGRRFSLSLSMSFSEKLFNEEDELIEIGGESRVREGLSERGDDL